MVTTLAGDELMRKTTFVREKLGKAATRKVDPITFRCIRHPELVFLTGGEVVIDQLGRQRRAIPAKRNHFYNTQFVAQTAEEVEYCRSKKGVIFEEPPIPPEAYDENGKYDPELDARQFWDANDDQGRTTFKTYNRDCWKAYQKQLNS